MATTGTAGKSASEDIAPSSGKVPILWDGEAVVWDSLAIIEYLADKVGRDRFWPKADDARAMARSMVAEMHSSYLALRGECPMNIRRQVEGAGKISDQPPRPTSCASSPCGPRRARGSGKGGPFLFGTFQRGRHHLCPGGQPVHDLWHCVPGFALAYMEAVWEHEWLQAGSPPPRPRTG
jgi:glutathione S-transferase